MSRLCTKDGNPDYIVWWLSHETAEMMELLEGYITPAVN